MGTPRTLDLRSRILQSVRAFFHALDYTEVETPVRIPTPALELHIDAVPSGDAYLRTSPELHIKRLIADGLRRVFELGPCFREGERGERHNVEFTMLEWYRTGADYRDMARETRALLVAVAQDALGTARVPYRGQVIDLDTEWADVTVRDVFREFAGWDPLEAFDADRFDADLVERVEPRLPVDRPVILRDYPVERAALARRREEHPPVAERWELYAGGMELANAFSELTDAAEQRRRFEACRDQRANLGKAAYDPDTAFLDALEAGLPDCGGVALGVDRLVMLLSGETDIRAVRSFLP